MKNQSIDYQRLEFEIFPESTVQSPDVQSLPRMAPFP